MRRTGILRPIGALCRAMPGRGTAPAVRLNVETEPTIPGIDDVLRERLVVFAWMRKRNVRGSSGCWLDNQIHRIARIRSDAEQCGVERLNDASSLLGSSDVLTGSHPSHNAEFIQYGHRCMNRWRDMWHFRDDSTPHLRLGLVEQAPDLVGRARNLGERVIG